MWTIDQLREFLSVAGSHRLSAAFVLMATTGMRRSEVLGLRWSDIDFDDSPLVDRSHPDGCRWSPRCCRTQDSASRRLGVPRLGHPRRAARTPREGEWLSAWRVRLHRAGGQPVNPPSFTPPSIASSLGAVCRASGYTICATPTRRLRCHSEHIRLLLERTTRSHINRSHHRSLLRTSSPASTETPPTSSQNRSFRLRIERPGAKSDTQIHATCTMFPTDPHPARTAYEAQRTSR